jgi:hypothetical protein
MYSHFQLEPTIHRYTSTASNFIRPPPPAARTRRYLTCPPTCPSKHPARSRKLVVRGGGCCRDTLATDDGNGCLKHRATENGHGMTERIESCRPTAPVGIRWKTDHGGYPNPTIKQPPMTRMKADGGITANQSPYRTGMPRAAPDVPSACLRSSQTRMTRHQQKQLGKLLIAGM